MPEPRPDERRAVVVEELGERPLRVIVRERRERRERLELPRRLEPSAHVRAGHAAPCIDAVQHVEVPQHQQLDRQIQHRRVAQVGEVHQPAQT